MTQEEFDNYKFSKNTQVDFRGGSKWSPVTEVWFDEGKIGIKDTRHLVDFSEIKYIKD